MRTLSAMPKRGANKRVLGGKGGAGRGGAKADDAGAATLPAHGKAVKGSSNANRNLAPNADSVTLPNGVEVQVLPPYKGRQVIRTISRSISDDQADQFVCLFEDGTTGTVPASHFEEA